MKVEFNDNSYNVGNKIGRVACTGCIMNGGRNLKCPADSEGSCILPLNKVYTDLSSSQVFKL